ncbi:MAG: T9SS type A sorting domain-containing protein [Bacteroidetes bacterium]|nr:T9SS type A sorting domain-containing protein [Bacteroidota bacterium]
MLSQILQKEILHVQFESSTISKGSILLKSLEGRLVKSIDYVTPESNPNKNSSTIETSIDLENISRGAYILQVIQDNGKSARKVIVIE